MKTAATAKAQSTPAFSAKPTYHTGKKKGLLQDAKAVAGRPFQWG